MPATVTVFSPLLPRSFTVSPAFQPWACATVIPAMISALAFSSFSSSQRPSVTSHQERMPTTPASSSSPVGRDKWWLNQLPFSFTALPSGSTAWVSRKGAKSTMLNAQKIVLILPRSPSFSQAVFSSSPPSPTS